MAGGPEGTMRAWRLVTWLASQEGAAGVGYAVAVNGKGIVSRGSMGYASVPRREVLGESHAFPVASITKMFTGLTASILDIEGILPVTEPVGPLLGLDLEVDSIPVTMEHLLSHTVGVPALGYAEALIRGILGESRPWRPFTDPWQAAWYLEEALKSGAAVARPGERFFYLNEGFVVAGLAIEKARGKPYAAVVGEEILEPLGLSSAFFLGEEPRSPVAHGHVRGDGGLTEADPPPGILADGGLVIRLDELALFGLVYAGAYGDYEEAVSVQVKPRAVTPWRLTGKDYYGLGVMINEGFLGGTLVGHGGSLLSVNSWLGVHREEGVSVAVAVNSPSSLPQIAGLALLAGYLGGDPLTVEPVGRHLTLLVLEGDYEGYDGNYRARLTAGTGYLELEMLGYKVPLVPVEVEPCKSAVFIAPTRLGTIEVTAEIRGDEVILWYERYLLRRKLAREPPCRG